MRHFTTEDAVDFVNQVIPASQKRAMEEHRKNCRRCSKAVSQLQRVRECAAAEPNYQPPQETVRNTRSAFAALELALRGKTRGASIEVLFDSFLQPALGRVRSAGGATRHVLYRADPFQIDVQIELQPGEERLVVTGQLVGSRDPQIVGRNLAVILANMRGRIVRTATNQFGEFRTEIENSGDLELVFFLAAQRPIVISLPNVLACGTS
jgi:hypothetical protein